MNTLELIAAQRDREPQAKLTAEAKAALLNVDPQQVVSALRKAERAARPGKRIRLVLQAVSTWAEPIAMAAACRRGCAHCCRIPVVITGAEARLLASASGKPMSLPTQGARVFELGPNEVQRLSAGDQQVTNCPFLVGDECSVYDVRPVACRSHFSLDVDDLLCRVVPALQHQYPMRTRRRSTPRHRLCCPTKSLLTSATSFLIIRMPVKTSNPKSIGILAPPSPAEIKAARKVAGLTGAEASLLVHCNERSWRKWESGDREMHPAFWELFLIKCAAAVDAPA